MTKPALPQPQKSPYLLRPKKEKAEEEEKRVTRQKKASSTHTADSGVSNTSPVRAEDMYEDTDYSYDSSDSSDSSGSSDSDDSSTAKQYVSDGSSGHSEPRTPEWEDESEATADSAVSDVSSRPPSRIEQRQVQRFVIFMAFTIYGL